MYLSWPNTVSFQKYHDRGFLGGLVVGSPSANAGDTGSTPGWGGANMLQSIWSCALQLLKLLGPRACALQQKKQWRWEAFIQQRKVAPVQQQRESPLCSNKDPAQLKMNKINLKKKKYQDKKMSKSSPSRRLPNCLSLPRNNNIVMRFVKM